MAEDDAGLRGEFTRREEAIWKEINRISHTVYGNGQDGMTVRLAVIQKVLETLELHERSRGRKEWAVILLLLGLLIEKGFWILAGRT